MMFPSCFQQNLLILSKISKIENPRRRPSAAILGFLFCYRGNSGWLSDDCESLHAKGHVLIISRFKILGGGLNEPNPLPQTLPPPQPSCLFMFGKIACQFKG